MQICNKRALDMPYRLKIQLKYLGKNENIVLNCNYMQICNKKSTRDGLSFKNTVTNVK